MQAILHSENVRIDYTHSNGHHDVTEIQPYSLAIYDHQLYVFARNNKHPLYPYRFSRITEVERMGTHFEYPSKHEYDPARDFADSFGVFVTDNFLRAEVVLRLRGYWAGYAYSHRWHPSQHLDRRPDGSVDMRMTVRVCPELENWILSLGESAEVLKPADLRTKVAGRIAAMGSVYGGPQPVRARPLPRRPSGEAVARSPARPARSTSRRS